MFSSNIATPSRQFGGSLYLTLFECSRWKTTATKWKQVNPEDWNLAGIVKTLEQAVTVQIEEGLEAQVLRAKTRATSRVIKKAVEDAETWVRALVFSTDDYSYILLAGEF